jgi:hypothetical protein
VPGKNKKRRIVFDIESTPAEQARFEGKYRVWSWSAYDFDSDVIVGRGLTIDSLYNFFKVQTQNNQYFAHNSKWDAGYLLYNLHERGYTYDAWENRRAKVGTYNCIISEMGYWYSFSFCFGAWQNKGRKGAKKKVVTIINSYNLIKSKVEDIPKGFGLNELKGTIDYEAYRPQGYKPTQEEWNYNDDDVIIVGKGLKILDGYGINKLTIGSSVLHNFKKEFFARYNLDVTKPSAEDRERYFRKYFPELDSKIDTFCRNAYFGGKNLKNTYIKEIQIFSGVYCFDIASQYPFVKAAYHYPWGQPKYFSGDYIEDVKYPLYIIHVKARLILKDGYQPTIFTRQDSVMEKVTGNKIDNEYDLYLTNVDLEDLEVCYHILEWEVIDGYKFRSTEEFGVDENGYNKIFGWFYKKYYDIKKNAEGAFKLVSKYYINNLGGKFGTKSHKYKYYPVINEKGKISLKKHRAKPSSTLYVPVACFMTAYGRRMVRKVFIKNRKIFLYGDTDSGWFKGLPEIENIDWSDVETLGSWGLEHQQKIPKEITNPVERAIFRKINLTPIWFKPLKEKTYAYSKDNKLWIYVKAGLHQKKENPLNINIDDFKFGAVLPMQKVENFWGGFGLIKSSVTIHPSKKINHYTGIKIVSGFVSNKIK